MTSLLARGTYGGTEAEMLHNALGGEEEESREIIRGNRNALIIFGFSFLFFLFFFFYLCAVVTALSLLFLFIYFTPSTPDLGIFVPFHTSTKALDIPTALVKILGS